MDFQGKGAERLCVFKRQYIFDIWYKFNKQKLSCTERAELVFNEVHSSVSIEDKENYSFETLHKRVSYICKRIQILWRKHHYDKDLFQAKQIDWLEAAESVGLGDSQPMNLPETSSKKCGRPKKDYADCSKRTRQWRRSEVCQLDESLRSAFSDEAGVSARFTEPSVSDVVSLIVEAKLTKHQYLLIRSFVNDKLLLNFLPSYKSVLKEKQNCYPTADQITVTESSAEVELQALLDHTASRLLESQKEVLESHSVADSDNSLVLMGKWGFDGSSGHSEYKQSFSDSETIDDSNLFVTSYAPLQLLQRDVVIWKNLRPSSTRYTRPFRFRFVKETTEVSLEEERYFSEKINALQATKITMGNRDWNVRHNLQLTMVDGTVCNALTATFSTKCYICEATPKQMNNIDLCLQKAVSQESLAFGLSPPLHAWIRFFEFFLHVSYRLDVQSWQVRGEKQKKKCGRKKKLIQSLFREKMGLIVDKPKPGGSGTSNDGNTARKFFENRVLSAEITGIDENLISRCATILLALGSGYKINADKFQEFAMTTARQIVEIYPWYYMPASVHKILIHGSNVIEHALLSIGELSEEAAEARNKDIKAFRFRHTRKMSRVVTNRDLLNRLLLSSDPLISGLRKLPRKKKTLLSKAVLELCC